jgi:hypothetical protein
MEDMIFISHCREDGYPARLVQKELKDAGFDAWIDLTKISAGDKWKAKIEEAIDKSFILLLVITPYVINSKYVNYEYAYALGKGIKVIPLMFKKTKLPPTLEDMEYLDFTDTKNPPFEVLIRQLKRNMAQRTLEDGWKFLNQGRIQDARLEFVSCLEIFKDIDDRMGVATSHELLGRVALAEKNLDESKKEHLMALEIYNGIENDEGSKRTIEFIKYIDGRRNEEFWGWIFNISKIIAPAAILGGYLLSQSPPKENDKENTNENK